MKKVELYTDGACSGNPGAGGYGAILLYKDARKEISGGEPYTTNNRLDIYAVIAGLEKPKQPSEVKVYSYSEYTVNAFKHRWVYARRRSGWKADTRKPL